MSKIQFINAYDPEKHYSYDAFYIENALRLGVPVLSLDKGLIAVAEKRGVTCL